MNVLGVYPGIGSMMVYFRDNPDYKVLGSIEDRNQFKNETFEKNFNAPQFPHLPSRKELGGRPDIMVGHPSCTFFSGLNNTHKSKKYADSIANYVKMVDHYKPAVFVLENLNKAHTVYNEEYFKEHLHKYHTQIHFVNFKEHRGGQNRKRMIVIGTRFEYEYTLEKTENEALIETCLSGNNTAHDNDITIQPDDAVLGWTQHSVYNNHDYTTAFAEDMVVLCEQMVNRGSFKYWNRNGEQKTRIGCRWKWSYEMCPVVNGTAWDGIFVRDKERYLTLRERLRLADMPDDFILYPLFDRYGSTEYRKCLPMTSKICCANYFIDLFGDIEDQL